MMMIVYDDHNGIEWHQFSVRGPSKSVKIYLYISKSL
eukprot:COSAG05_NODE_13349_length_433_cov_1.532934_1_plen_37_part_01